MPKHNQLKYILHKLLQICTRNKYVLQIRHKCYICQTVDCHILGMYTHTYVTHEVTDINDMSRNAVHKQQ